MGVYNAELFNNLGLCCFYAQQYDMTLTCFERALSLAEEQTMSDVWFNIGHVALVSRIIFVDHSSILVFLVYGGKLITLINICSIIYFIVSLYYLMVL